MTDRDRFEGLIGLILKHEGGYANDPDDPGGETNYGISKRSYPKEDIKGMTAARAKDIYYRDYWLKLKCNEIKSDQVAQKVLDMGVNLGRWRATTLVQKAAGDCGTRLEIDGVMDSRTINAINKQNPEALMKALRARHKDFYLALIAGNSVNEKYRNGWLKRASA